MDKSWMQLPNRFWPDYIKGIRDFIEIARGHTDISGKTRCPCKEYKNRNYKHIDEVQQVDVYGHNLLHNLRLIQKMIRAACKRKRGKAVNNKVIDYKAITLQNPRIEIHPKYARPVRRWSSQFVREVGLVARQHGPLTGHDWSNVEDDVRRPLRDRIVTQQPVGMTELYRRTHLSTKGWTSLVAEENYDRMQQLKDELEAEGVVPKTEDKIRNMVLGLRSGYSKGLGHGVLPQSSKRVSSIQLEEEVQRRKDEEEFQRRRAEEVEKRNEELTTEMGS
ncbi:hypothetical protein GIB67_003371 [Kingdonia uniflora]|uniref:Transposase-associated domain-containing protein n=1 Tax=Kingdonia uniflora TaxID=39325 RepID=A0A7J7P968_9MAGN|nr:hypothetical protein GIB67_003371 [Kingdonia uniflora]